MIYSKIRQRVFDLLKNNDEISEIFSQFHLGTYSEPLTFNTLPGIGVVDPNRIENSRESVGPSSSVNTISFQKITYEIWIVIVMNEPTPFETQTKMIETQELIIKMFENNVQLKDDKGEDPISINLEIASIDRLTQYKGDIVDGITIILRPVVFK